MRTPNAVVSRNSTESAASVFSGGTNVEITTPGRPRFMITGVNVTSTAPAANSRSITDS